jgi:outer membrane biosynthesis protein TonB
LTDIAQNINPKALAWTIAVHALLFLLFFLWKYQLPAQVITAEDMGMEVNLGSSDNGSGKDQPLSIESPAASKSKVAYTQATEKNDIPKDILQNDNPDNPSINTESKKNNTPQQANDKKPLPQHAKYVYTGSAGKGGNNALQDAPGSNEGNTTGPGDRGVPGGTRGATQYTGAPGTDGISHTLNGRFITEFPAREADYNEDGRVVIRVTVNREGKITQTQILAATSEELRVIALRKCAKVLFNAAETAPLEQFGNITFVFRTHS